jgi:hypothetical protein
VAVDAAMRQVGDDPGREALDVRLAISADRARLRMVSSMLRLAAPFVRVASRAARREGVWGPVMRVIRRATSPDGRLELQVVEHDGTRSIGFVGSGWHVHPDAIFDVYYPDESGTDAEAEERFWSDVLGDRLVISIERLDGGRHLYEVCDSTMIERVSPEAELRYWSGKPAR